MTSLIPPIKIINHILSKNVNDSLKPTAMDVLTDLARKFDCVVEYKTVLKSQGHAPIFNTNVKVGDMEGESEGGTAFESKNRAAVALLKSIESSYFEQSGEILEYRPIVKTELHRDILYILNGICDDLDIMEPKYEFTNSPNGEGVICKCTVGNIVIQDSGFKKRVVSRYAAIKMYRELQKRCASGTVPDGIKKK